MEGHRREVAAGSPKRAGSVVTDVGPLDDFPTGDFKLVTVGNREIGIFRTDDGVYAVLNRCPHMGGPVCEGHVGPKLEGLPGEIETDQSDFVLSCPWHHWEFRVTDGSSAFASRYRVKTFPVTVKDGRVIVDISRPASATKDPAPIAH